MQRACVAIAGLWPPYQRVFSPGAAGSIASAWTPACEFGGQQLVDGAVPLDPALAGEGRRDDADAEMRLAGAVIGAVMAGAVMVMAGMEMALVDDRQPLGRKRRGRACLPSSPVWTSPSFLHHMCAGPPQHSCACAPV